MIQGMTPCAGHWRYVPSWEPEAASGYQLQPTVCRCGQGGLVRVVPVASEGDRPWGQAGR